jgi:hypothetical protein
MYDFIYNGETYELPKYTLKINDLIEKSIGSTLKETIRRKIDAIRELLGEDFVSQEIGNVNECDINVVNSIFEDIKETYNQVSERTAIDLINKRMDDLEIDKLASLINKIDTISSLEKKLK